MNRLYKILLSIAKRLWPQLDEMRLDRQLVGVGEVSALFYSLPLAVIGFLWLLQITDWEVVSNNIVPLSLMFALSSLFLRLRFFFILELRENRYGSSDGSMANGQMDLI